MSTFVVGGGAGALALLTAAALSPDGLEPLLADGGLTVVDSGPRERFGAGRLGGYRVRSDTRGRVFAESLSWLDRGSDQAVADLLARVDTDDPVPLPAAGRLLALAGAQLLGRLEADPRVSFLPGTRLVCLRPDGDRTSLTLRANGQARTQAARRVFLALGGRPRIPPELGVLGRQLIHSDAALRSYGGRVLLAALARRSPTVLVVGGSHSAFAVTGRLLRSRVPWERGAIVVAHRSPVRVTYPDVESARAQGVSVTPADVCPATGVVNRFGGLRADAAALYARIRSGAEPRVRLVDLSAGEQQITDLVPASGPVIAATGYGSGASGLVAEKEVTEGAERVEPGWDGLGRLRGGSGDVVQGVFGLGLGTHRPRGPGTGGEPSFAGSIDGFWFYQHIVAPALLGLQTS